MPLIIITETKLSFQSSDRMSGGFFVWFWFFVCLVLNFFLKKKPFPYIWYFYPKLNLSKLKDLKKFTSAELKGCVPQPANPSTTVNASYIKMEIYESIGEKKELVILLHIPQDLTIISFCSKNFFLSI